MSDRRIARVETAEGDLVARPVRMEVARPEVERVLVEVADANARDELRDAEPQRQVVVRRHVAPAAGEHAANEGQGAGLGDDGDANVAPHDEAQLLHGGVGEVREAWIGELLAAVRHQELADLQVGPAVVGERDVEGHVEQAEVDAGGGVHGIFAAQGDLEIEGVAVVAPVEAQPRVRHEEVEAIVGRGRVVDDLAEAEELAHAADVEDELVGVDQVDVDIAVGIGHRLPPYRWR